jgi:hypothetical protein
MKSNCLSSYAAVCVEFLSIFQHFLKLQMQKRLANFSFFAYVGAGEWNEAYSKIPKVISP